MEAFVYKNTQICYSEKGKGNTLVFLHGFLENKNMWKPYVDYFSQRYRVITIDLLGHGKSACLGYIHTMEDQADMIFALLSDLRIRKATFVGHSMGGYVALAFGELYPEHLKGLVLINASTRADSEEREINRDRAVQVVKKNAAAFITMAINNLFEDADRTRLSAEIEIIRNQALETSLQGVVASLEGMKVRSDREVLLHFGPYEKMLITGSKDQIAKADDILNETSEADVTTHILDCGHMAPLEKESEIIQLIQTFLRKK